MTAIIALQKGLRARLAETAAVTDLVPAGAILDRNELPAPDPSIVLGEHQELPGDDVARKQFTINSTLHIWKAEPSLAGVQAIAGAVRSTLHASRLALDDGYHCGDCHVIDARFMRDPDGKTGHGVMTIASIVTEID